jgi:hypothetical protein
MEIQETEGQSSSDKWFKERFWRLTASMEEIRQLAKPIPSCNITYVQEKTLKPLLLDFKLMKN